MQCYSPGLTDLRGRDDLQLTTERMAIDRVILASRMPIL